MSKVEQVQVIQADREAAAAYYYSAGGSTIVREEIADGRKDDWFRVVKFADHRRFGEGRITAVAEALDWALSEIEGRTVYRDNELYSAAEQRENALSHARSALDEASYRLASEQSTASRIAVLEEALEEARGMLEVLAADNMSPDLYECQKRVDAALKAPSHVG